MLHVPGLVLTDQGSADGWLIGKLSCVVRGMYGEGSEAAGNIFQVSNQITMGQSETEVLAGLVSLTSRVVQEERQARARLLDDMRPQVEDRIWRAWGLVDLRQDSDLARGIAGGIRIADGG